MILLNSYVQSGFTLHSLLSMLEFLISLLVLCALVTKALRKLKPRWKRTPWNWLATGVRYATSGALSLAVRTLATFHIIISRTKGAARYWPVWFTAIFAACVVFAASRLPREAVVTENHVAIIGKLENGDFAFVSDEEPHGGTFRPCAEDSRAGVDTPALLSQGVGYIADSASWEERGVCKSILREDLGFWFKDKRNNFTYRRLPNARTTE